MNKYQALHSFWSSFSLKAYDETSVPNTAELPYITYESMFGEFGDTLAVTASVWYRSTSWSQVTEKVTEIENQIGRGGCIVPYDGGTLWICKGTPFAQRMSDASDDMIRRMVLNLQIEFES